MNWDKLKLVFKQINHGQVKVKIENGEPVCVPPQVIMKIKGDKSSIKVVKKTIDLTRK